MLAWSRILQYSFKHFVLQLGKVQKCLWICTFLSVNTKCSCSLTQVENRASCLANLTWVPPCTCKSTNNYRFQGIWKRIFRALILFHFEKGYRTISLRSYSRCLKVPSIMVIIVIFSIFISHGPHLHHYYHGNWSLRSCIAGFVLFIIESRWKGGSSWLVFLFFFQSML